jgi:hypothetical protein
MIRAENAIARLRRDLTLAMLIRWGLVAGVLLALLMEGVGLKWISGTLVLAVVGGVWIYLSYRSMRGSRFVAESPQLIAAGMYERAEEHIDEAIRSFSLFRHVKLRALHHLAVLRHAQRRWADAALLCRALLGERLGSLAGLTRSAKLMLADALLEVGDVRGAYEVLQGLYQQRLSLSEALELTAVQTDYLARVGAWQRMLEGLRRKVDLSELMPAERSARVQAQLALAARRSGHGDWENFLRRRAELLADVNDLVARRPMLAELWPAGRAEQKMAD